eukprot:NODE_4004_length_1949_cov_10.892426.p1 GENE.NODE_4004_length_1949_cov_10.892426~~NODE_4004_length_1949_cov_10.892426.p1  ORF type:complete len:553 (+),score=77.67 NODE_4004_length_1949_cov_10.892426:120-1661(+)
MGTAVEHHPAMGRVVVATRDFDKGEVVIDEAPLLVWANGDIALLSAYRAAPLFVQETVLGMFHPPLDSNTPVISCSRTIAYRLARQHHDLGLDTELAHKLLAIANTNAHTYYGEKVPFTEMFEGSQGTPKSALFDLSSKVAHSCLPNTSCSSKNESGHLRYTAIRQMKAGDQVTCPYIDHLWSTPVHERRAMSLERKDFVCQCPRCVAPDDCRVLCCRRKCKSFMMASHGPSGQAPRWSCSACGALEEVDVAVAIKDELRLGQELEHWQAMGQSGQLHQIPPSQLQALVMKATSLLSPTHFLVVRALEFLATVCASHSVHTERAMRFTKMSRGPHGTPRELREASAAANLRAARVCECVAVGCQGGERCAAQHGAVHECVGLVFFSGEDWKQLGSAGGTPKDLAEAILRYLPAMRITYGSDDDDVLALERMAKHVQENKRLLDPQASGPGQAAMPISGPTGGIGSSSGGGCCASCGASGVALKFCAKCRRAQYCSKMCQKSHWKEHKSACASA